MKKFNKISYKLNLAISLVIIIVIVIFSFYLIDSYRRQMISIKEMNASQISEIIKKSTRDNMLDDAQEDLRKTIKALSRQDGIEKIRIFNKEGSIIESSDDYDITRTVDKKAEACYGCHQSEKPLERLKMSYRVRIFQSKGEDRFLGIINPIYNEKCCWVSKCHAHKKDIKVLGVLDIVMSLKEIESATNYHKLRIIFLTIFAILSISFIVWRIIKKMIADPLEKLMEATNAVADGDLNYRIEYKSKCNLGALSTSFNEMTQRLSDVRIKLYQFNKLASLGRLAGGVAHEINNPLTAVLTYSSFILKRAGNDEEMKNDLEVIVRETKRCREIVKGLLDFARQAPPRKTKTDINEVLSQAISVINPQLQKKNIKLVKELEGDIRTMLIDRTQIAQVFINLLVNAVDAIDKENGEIKIETQINLNNGVDFYEAKISDNGMGIDDDKQSKIFEAFFSTKGRKGTGLGLAVVWGILDQHGGLILVDSKKGKGTTFTIRLPLMKDAKVI